MRDGGNNIVYEKVLAYKYAANIEVLNGIGVNLKSHPMVWFNVFYLLNPKSRQL